jgi:hypothetical protein
VTREAKSVSVCVHAEAVEPREDMEQKFGCQCCESKIEREMASARDLARLAYKLQYREGKGRKNEQVPRHVSSVTLVTTRSSASRLTFHFFTLLFFLHSPLLHSLSLLTLVLVLVTVCATVLVDWRERIRSCIGRDAKPLLAGCRGAKLYLQLNLRHFCVSPSRMYFEMQLTGC